MTPTEYIKNVLITENNDEKSIMVRFDWKTIRILHALLGINTENGELQDQFKKHVFYGRELDKTNLVEEIGDLMWYMALLCNELGVSFEEVWEKNIAKLNNRYKGGKFTETKALGRDLVEERKILEGDK